MATDSKGQVLCTTNGKPVADVRASQTNEVGQHDAYIVLCPDERAKGFVRPYRDAYKHVGAKHCKNCGATSGSTDCDATGFACEMERPASLACGTVTTMGRALSETYARDPNFYNATFCVHCQVHRPLSEFVWVADGAEVGS